MTASKQHTKVRVSYTCPKCRRDLERINRRSIDKLIGLVIPVRRYKCMGCFWEGLRISHSRN